MKLKFCGFTNITDVEKVKDLNIDAVGFVHYPKSKRFVSIEEIRDMMNRLPDDKEKVVVVVNPNIQQLEDLIQQTALTTIQFHGDEPLETLKYIKQNYPNLKVIKAIAAKSESYLQQAITHYQPFADRFIIDTPSEKYGGTGQRFNWNMLKSIEGVSYWIAGGLNKENISHIESLNLKHEGYDIASGIETGQVKHLKKMSEIIKICKSQKETRKG